MSDLISRQEAIEWVKNLVDINRYYHPHSRSEKFPVSEVIDVLERIPNAELERKKGRWIRNFDGSEWYWYCSACKEQWYEEDLWMGGNDFPNFCPNCGADMREEKEAER